MRTANKHQRKTPRRERTNLSSSSDSGKMRDPVNVFCRLRNLKDDCEESCIKLVSPNTLCLSTPADNKILRRDMKYVFKHIFTAASTQNEVFEHVAYPLVQGLLAGKNGLLFAYGVTGSGKTYTLTGEQNNPGVMPRCIDTLFNTISELQTKKFIIKWDKMNGFEVQTEKDAEDDRALELGANARTPRPTKKASETTLYANDGTRIPGVNESNLYAVFVSYVEIYNNLVFDLLDDLSGKVPQSKILREDAQKNMYVNNVVEVEVKSSSEAFELFNSGQRRKRMGHTVLNSESSRSHSIFNIRLVQFEQRSQSGEGDVVVPERNFLKVGQLSLVDLAGSERSSRTQNTGKRLKEASSINNSLLSLRTCMEILRDNQLNNANRLVPYRDSRLTLLFKNYFEGEGQVQMIVCVNPSVQDYEENLQVMKFAEMTQDVKVNKAESRYTPYRKVQRAGKANETPRTSKVKNAAPMIFGPKIHSIKLNCDDFDAFGRCNLSLINVLKARCNKSRLFKKEVLKKERNFRRRLIAVDKSNVICRSEVKSLKALFKNEQQKCRNLETKVLDLEAMNDNAGGKVDELQSVIRSLQCTIDEKDLKINQNLLEKERSKQKLALQKEKMDREVDAHLRRQRDELHAQMHAKDIKLRKVRQIIDNDVRLDCAGRNVEAEVQTFELQQTPENVRKDTPHKSNVGSTRRRSRSMGEVWLEHNAVKPVALGTVFQPTMKRRKSVTKLSKASDVTNPKQSKYCLIAQETDDDGDIETKLYKADIVQTCGGGAQVIFNDVERLRQESPLGTPTGPSA